MIHTNKKIFLISVFLISYLNFNNTNAELIWNTCTSPTQTELNTYVFNNKTNINAVNTYIKPYIDCIHSDEYDYIFDNYKITSIDTSNECFITLKNNEWRVVYRVVLKPEWAYDINPNPSPSKAEIDAQILVEIFNHVAGGWALKSWVLLNKINDIRKPHTTSYVWNTYCHNYEMHKIISITDEWGWLYSMYCNNGVDRVLTPTCTCDNWSSEWSSCDANPYNWATVNECTRQCIQNLVWTSEKKLCSLVCNPKWPDETKTNTVEIPWCDPTNQCWTHNWAVYTASDTTWGSGTFCTSWTPTTVSFPDEGTTKTWICGTEDCSARRTNSRLTYCWDWIKQGLWETVTQNSFWETEACDLWNLNGIWNCTTSCTIPICIGTSCGWWDPYCWDWTEDAWEQCDDGNNISWDWCSSTCTEETDPITGWYCWDWEVQNPNSNWDTEVCDDWNYISNDSCTNSCRDPHTSQPWSKTYCWDWKKQWSWETETSNSFWIKEECDDGNTNNSDTCTNNCTLLNTSQPGEVDVVASAICVKSSSGYADDLNTIPIYAKLTIDNIEDSKDVINLWTPKKFTDLSNNVTDRVNMIWDSSLTFSWVEINWNPAWWKTQLVQIGTVKSKTPFVDYSNKISFELVWQTMVLDWVCYNFKKPYIWKLTLSSSWNVSLWTKLKYKLSADWDVLGASDYTIWLWVNNISHLWTGITLQNTKLMSYLWGKSREFETRINSSIYAKAQNNQPWLQVVLPTITYTLGGKTISYYLSAYDYANNRTPITLIWKKFLWIKIIGWLQWAWKYEFTGQWKNISDISTSDIRTEIRKRAYDYTKKMTNWKILNKVRYVVWDITISGEIPQTGENSYETLVVKNGNVIISWDLNTSGKKLWIIVLKDNYNVSTWYTGKWNVLIKPEVKIINAIIYADWWFISADSNWTAYIYDSTERTNALQNQLTMKWSLFTRNTIWWAQYVWWYYTLPGWTKTQSFDKAMIYDLNYIRRWNDWCNKNASATDTDCTDIWEYEEWFIIKYDSKIQTDPPKLFYK